MSGNLDPEQETTWQMLELEAKCEHQRRVIHGLRLDLLELRRQLDNINSAYLEPMVAMRRAIAVLGDLWIAAERKARRRGKT